MKKLLIGLTGSLILTLGLGGSALAFNPHNPNAKLKCYNADPYWTSYCAKFSYPNGSYWVNYCAKYVDWCYFNLPH